jgi:hypothetical protein
LAGLSAVLTHDPLQAVRPGGQLAAHFPPEHTSMAPQGLSQLPQWAALVDVSTHVEPHFLKPSSQRMPHTFWMQIASPNAGVSQALSQPPQWRGSLPISTQASAQCWNPSSQSTTQLAPSQRLRPFSGFTHESPQSPQCSRDVATSTQALPHWVRVLGHMSVQPPGAHTSSGAQAVSQSPQ